MARLLVAAIALTTILESRSVGDDVRAKSTMLGTAYSPAHYPPGGAKDVLNFFTVASEIGSHVCLIGEWNHPIAVEDLKRVMLLCRMKGLKFHLYLSPIAQFAGRKDPAIPSRV